MLFLVGLMTATVLGMIVLGIVLEMNRGRPFAPPRLLRGAVAANLALFALALGAVVFMGIGEVSAQTQAAAGGGDVSIGKGLALIGIGIPTALASIAAAIALGPVGSSALAVLAEKPEMFGRTLVYLGLAEGIAIYGLVISILMLGRI
ncbi:MAG: ATP synthase subunit C [Burkholderiales bacterium]|jgi:V/A-type H+-transporting ATPase subunit K|nr:ATP synthase subunit C [Burkholderiales bacterium]